MPHPRYYQQQDEDAARLPEGFKRIGYDTDTKQYTFQDRDGALWVGQPGEEYGHLTPILDPIGKAAQQRPEAFNDTSGQDRAIPISPRNPDEAVPRSFHDMLPSSLITSPTTKPDEEPPSTFAGLSALVSPPATAGSMSGGHQRHGSLSAAFPKVVGLVDGLKRSMSKRREGGGGFRRSYRHGSASNDSKQPFDGDGDGPYSAYGDSEKEKQGLLHKTSRERWLEAMERKD